jgi:hypothetical protein
VRVTVRQTALLWLAFVACAAGAQSTGAQQGNQDVSSTTNAQGTEASTPAPGAGFATESTLASDVHSVVNSGHVGPVLDLLYDDRRNLLFSAGQDGTVRVWDVRDGVLYRSLRVTRLAAQMIAVDPVNPRVAVVVSDGIRSFSLSVWDWEQERQVLRYPLSDAPLFLRFSGQGRYVVFGESSWQSLTILDAQASKPVLFHPEGFGIVAFAEISKSEKTIMTYQVSGRISYWDMASGSLTLEVPTIPYLSHVRISQDRRYLVGTNGREVALIDCLNGSVRGRAPFNGSVSLDISPAEDQVAAVALSGGNPSEWSLQPGSFAVLPLAPKTDPSGDSLEAFQALCYGSNGLYLAGKSGAIYEMSFSGDLQSIGKNMLADISGLDARRGFLAVGSRDWIRLFRSDILEESQMPGFVHSILIENPWKSPVGLSFLSDTSLLVWSKDDGPPRFAVLDVPGDITRTASVAAPGALQFRALPSGFHAPLIDLVASSSSLLGIENGGMVRVVDPFTGASRFEAHVSALSAVVAISPTELIGGKNTALSFGGSLVRINTRTGETVALPGRNVYTWDLIFDPTPPGAEEPALYSLGVDGSGATNLLRHDGPGFERETVLASEPEENLDASLALDPSTHELYASMTRTSVVSWNGVRASAIPTEYGAVGGLVVCADLMMSLDRDSILVMEDKASGSRIAALYLFQDGEWAAEVRGGGYLASPGGDVHVKVFLNGSLMKATEDYRLRIESW